VGVGGRDDRGSDGSVGRQERSLRALILTIAAITASVAARGPAPASPQEIANVAAFTRLYGVVRYFYPSDAAARLDWDRFAVYGVGRARGAHDTAGLRDALDALVHPLGPGIEIGTRLRGPGSAPASGEPLVAWRYLGPGFSTADGHGPYAGMRTHRTQAIDGFVTLMQTVPAERLRGRTVRLRGKVRAATPDRSGGGALWLRVDRPNQGRGFFDNMSDRPVRDGQWREYAIEGEVAEDASQIAFGAMASGAVTADFDAIELGVRDQTGDWTPVVIEDPGFETASGGWRRAGTSRKAEVSRPATGAPEGRQFLRLSPPSGEGGGLFAETAPAAQTHVDFELGSGLRARVPLVLTDANARIEDSRKSALGALETTLAALPISAENPDIDVRLADVAVAWNVFRHFYPYWAETGVDWDARLQPRLRDAGAAESHAALGDALRELVADARDGHGGVTDPVRRPQAVLPILLGLVENRVVITASGVPADAPVAAEVLSIDGVTARRRLADRMRLFSGSQQWRQVRALRALTGGLPGRVVRLELDAGAGPREVSLRTEEKAPPVEKRPEPLAQLEPEVWYVDLTRTKMEQIAPRLETLARARGVVFDLRGYPGDAGAKVLPYLLDAPETDRWMHVAKLVGPFGRSAGWQSEGWDLTPAEPRLRGRIAFLTDARAISYAESVMGYVSDRKLGTIVGETTAGTNGNVVQFAVPSGFRIAFTGMRVTAHDGHTPFHLAGVKPDVPVAPTLAGLRRGRDEVLERAVALVVEVGR
jgi:Peptidase family S41